MSEWIKASLMPPENNDRVLASCCGDIFFARYYVSMKEWKRDPPDSPLYQEVRYWMPLPKPPN